MTSWKTPPGPMSGPIIFLDRDGVLIEDRHYLSDPAQVALLPGVPEALHQARKAEFILIGVSNQSGIGRGIFTPEDFGAVMTVFDQRLSAAGVPLDAFYFCPHAPRDGCACRKPRTGLLDEAESHFTWNANESWMVGDKSSDIELATAAGLGGILVRTGYGSEQAGGVAERWVTNPRIHVADDLLDAVRIILAARDPGATT